MGGRLLRARGAAAADADRPRSRAPVPADRQQDPQLRGRARRSRRVRARHDHRDRQGAARAAAGDQAAARGGRRRQLVRPALLGDPRAPRRSLPGPHAGRLLAVPRHPRRRPVDRRGGGEEPAPGAARRAARAPVRRAAAARGRGRLPAAPRAVPARPVRASRAGPLPLRRPGQPDAARLADRPGRRRRAQVHRVRAGAAGAHRRRARHPGRDAPPRHPAAPPLPVVRAGGRVHPPRGRRSRRRRDQADRLPHRRQLGADGGADRGGAGAARRSPSSSS